MLHTRIECTLAVLTGLPQQISTLLKRHRVTLISDIEASAIVPWLRPGEDVLLGETITVADAVFLGGVVAGLLAKMQRRRRTTLGVRSLV